MTPTQTTEMPHLKPSHVAYQAPTVTPIGSWQTVTLAQSVPVGPGSLGHLFDPANGDGDF